MDRKDSRSNEALVHVPWPPKPDDLGWEAARQIGSLLSLLQLPKTNRLSCIRTPIMLTLPMKHQNRSLLTYDEYRESPF
jgi:hypothetical protein